MAEWIAHWNCNFGTQRGELVVRGSSPGWGAKHFSILSVLSSATFQGLILNFNGNVSAYTLRSRSRNFGFRTVLGNRRNCIQH